MTNAWIDLFHTFITQVDKDNIVMWVILPDKAGWNFFKQAKGEAKVSYEKLHLENAWKLRGIYFIDPEDKEFKETIKNARKKFETPIAPAMPCKILKKNCGIGASNWVKSKLACILEASESTRLRMEESLPKYHKDHVAGKGDKSLQHDNLAHKFIHTLKQWRYPQQKQQ